VGGYELGVLSDEVLADGHWNLSGPCQPVSDMVYALGIHQHGRYGFVERLLHVLAGSALYQASLSVYDLPSLPDDAV
jgi:hypothetical protein